MLEAVQGYRLELTSLPEQSHIPSSETDKRSANLIAEEVESMLDKKAIQCIQQDRTEGFFSRIFLVPKKGGKFRPVVNLRPLNRCIRYRHFKMEGIHTVKDLLRRGDYMVRIDLKGCLFRHTNMLPASQVPAFPLEGPGLRVHMSPIRAGRSASCLHKGDEASCGIHQEQGSAVCGIHRRFSAHASEKTGSDRADSSDPELVGSSGIPGELFQVSSATISENRIPRIYDQLLDRGAQSPEGEGGSDQIRGNSPDGPGPGLSKRARSADWQNVGSHSGGLPSPTSLQEPSGTQTQGASGNQIRWSHKSVSRGKGGSPSVGQQFEAVEWPYNDKGQPTVVNRNRCILKGMGSILPRRSNRRMLEQRRTEAAYQRSGDASRVLCLKSIPEGQRRSLSPDPIRQHVGSSPYQQNGGDEISKASRGDKEKVCLVFAETDQVASSTSPRKSEHHSRFPVQAFERQNRLGPQCQHFQSHQSHLGSTTGGPICNSVFSSAKEIFQLEGGSRGRGNRCLFSELVLDTGFRTPTMVPNRKGTDEGSEGRGNDHSGHPAVEDPTLVPFPPEHAGGSTNSITRHSRSDHPFPKLRLPSVGISAPAGRMEGLRHHFRSKEIPNNAIELLMSSWRSKTISNYNSAWRKWEGWCKQRGMHPFAADVPSILGFLADQFEEGRQYRSLNCYRSALSSTHLPVEGFPVGQHPLVVRLLKGAYIQRPPKPRYSQTWDVTQMLAHLRSLGGNEALSLKLLTQKLAMLLALVLGHRSSDLVRLTLHGRSYIPEGVTLPCKGLAKQTRPGNEKSLQPVVIASFEEELLCPVACLRVYEKATAKFREDEAARQLFLAVVPPHRPVSSSTIARWIKKSLERAGLEPTFFPHSTRSAASTAAALSGLSTQEVMDRAGWSSLDTFCRYYFRPQSEFCAAKRFGDAVLGYKHAQDMLIEPEPPEVQSTNG